MRVLVIGSERNLFIDGSEAQKRIKEYGKLFDELRIIVFSSSVLGHSNLQLENKVFIYPTNHRITLFYLWNIYKITRSWRGWKPDIITCQDPFESGLVGWLLKMRYGLPLQLQIHADIFSPYFWQESFKNKIRVLLAKFLLPKADGIRVVSERIKNSLLTLYPKPYTLNPIIVLPIFVDVKKIQSAKPKINLHEKYSDYDFIILIASRLTKEKNVGMAIGAMTEVVKKYPKTLLLIVGDGPEEKKLKANVKFEPWANDLISYYKTADLFLLTSNYEGYGRTVVEAMAAGLPVIMTDVGLAGELLIDDLDGRVVPVGDVKALTQAILELMENTKKREDFKLNSLKLLEKWSTKQEYLEKYRDFLMMLK